MKNLLIFLFLIISVRSMAQEIECYKDICLKDIVRDSFGWGGEVVKISNSGVLTVALFQQSSYLYDFAYAEVGKAVPCHKGFCQNDRVMDPYGNHGLIDQIYTNDLVFLYYNDQEDDDQIYPFKLDKIQKE